MPDASPRLPPLRRNRTFRILSLSQGYSELGSSMTTLATPLLAFALTRSPGLAGVITMMVYAARVAFTLPIGGVIDRHQRKPIILACAAIGAATSSAVAVTDWYGVLTVPLLLTAAFIWGGVNDALKTAFAAAFREAVEARQRPRANAMRQARIQGVDLIGPPSGGALFGLSRALPFLFDALSYVLAAATLARWDEQYRPQSDSGAFTQNIKKGLEYVLRRSWLRSFCLWAAMLNLGGVSFDTCLNLRLAQRGVPSYQIGLVNTLGALCALLGALLAPRLIDRLPTSQLTVWTTLLGSGSFAACALSPSLPVISAFVAIGMFLFPANNAALSALIQTHTPDEMQGRANSSTSVLLNLVLPLAPLLAGWLLEAGLASWALAVCAGVVLTSLIPFLSNALLRSLPVPDKWEEVKV